MLKQPTAQDAVATFSCCHLLETLSTTHNEKRNVEEELATLQDVDDETCPVSENSEAKVAAAKNCKRMSEAVVLENVLVTHWVARRIEAAKLFPQLNTRISCHGTEDSVQDNARSVAHLRDRVGDVERTKNVRRDEIEDGDPGRRTSCSLSPFPLCFGDTISVCTFRRDVCAFLGFSYNSGLCLSMRMLVSSDLPSLVSVDCSRSRMRF